MEIPVYENEKPAGTLLVSAQGLYTVFEARLPAAPYSPPCVKGSAPVRTVGRGDTEENDEQKTHAGKERMNPPDLASLGHPPLGKGGKALPAHPDLPLTRLWLGGGEGDFASLGLLEPRRGERVFRRRLTRLELQKLPPQPWTALALPDGESPVSAAGEENTECRVASLPAMTDPSDPASNSPENSKLKTGNSSPWLPRPDGSLYDPERRLLALPWAGGEPPAPARKISVDGRDYLLFHT